MISNMFNQFIRTTKANISQMHQLSKGLPVMLERAKEMSAWHVTSEVTRQCTR